MEDSYKHKGLRRQLVSEVKEKGIKDEAVLTAMGKIPRHFFFDQIFESHAYEDKAFPIAAGQTISQPYTVAFQTELLAIRPSKKILEIGTGSGYQASVLCELGADVFSIEYQKELYDKAVRFLPALGYRPRLFHGDGSKGLSKFAPYDGIIVTAGAPTVPNDLIAQLKLGGRLVIPVGDNERQAMLLIVRTEKGFKKKVFNNFSFVPLRSEKGWDAK